ncbi:hypothetical protein NXW89_19340 [Bacteroides thetaiotaomicron]|nr:hypothetical protein [Bacteroides thetaiotaomicron]
MSCGKPLRAPYLYTIQNRFALLDSQYVAGTYRRDSFAAYFGYKFGSDNRKIRITASERYYYGYGYTSETPHPKRGTCRNGRGCGGTDNGHGFNSKRSAIFLQCKPYSRLDLTDVAHAIVGTLNLEQLYGLA